MDGPGNLPGRCAMEREDKDEKKNLDEIDRNLTAAPLVTGVTGISMTSYAAESTEEQTDLASVDLAGAAEAQPMKVDMSDGTYKIDVVLEGGSGRKPSHLRQLWS